MQQWTFLKGNSSFGTYTTYGSSIGVGLESSLNLPAGRNGHSMNAMSSSNSFVMFGGYTKYSSFTSGSINDIWRYNVSSNNWCLLKGSISVVNALAVYGTVGIANTTNVPTGMYSHGAAFSPGFDLLYVFAGSTYFNLLNELWVFNCSSAQWTFLASAGQAGNYTNGAQYPGARAYHSFFAIPNTSLFLMVNYFFDIDFLMFR